MHQIFTHLIGNKTNVSVLSRDDWPGGVGEQLCVFAPGDGGLWGGFGFAFNNHPAIFGSQHSFYLVVRKLWSTDCGWTASIILFKLAEYKLLQVFLYPDKQDYDTIHTFNPNSGLIMSGQKFGDCYQTMSQNLCKFLFTLLGSWRLDNEGNSSFLIIFAVYNNLNTLHSTFYAW